MAKADKKITGKTNAASSKTPAKKDAPKPKKREDEDDEDDVEGDGVDESLAGRKAAKTAASPKGKKKDDDDDDEDDDVEKEDDWEKVEEEENWDPDFAEFDVPKSKGKKTGGKKGVDEDEDFKIDDEVKDMFNDSDEFVADDDEY
jgi:hypothetical protein